MGGMWQRPVPTANRSVAIRAACVKSKPPALSWGGMIRKARRAARCGSIVQATQRRGRAPQDNPKGRVLSRCGFVGGLDRSHHYVLRPPPAHRRSEEHTSELQSLMRISYAVFCLQK